MPHIDIRRGIGVCAVEEGISCASLRLWPFVAGMNTGCSARTGVSATWIAFLRSHPRLHSKVVLDLESLVYSSIRPEPRSSWLVGLCVLQARG
jgi:hypothetical protein